MKMGFMMTKSKKGRLTTKRKERKKKGSYIFTPDQTNISLVRNISICNRIDITNRCCSNKSHLMKYHSTFDLNKKVDSYVVNSILAKMMQFAIINHECPDFWK